MSSERKLLAATALALLGGCADFSRGAPAPDAGADMQAGDAAADGAALSYAAAVNPLLVAACQRCHSAGQEAGGTSFLLMGDVAADYAVTIPLVDTTTPASSRLLAKMSGHG